MEKSFIEMKDEVEKLRAKSDSADDAKAYYGTWIKVLENHYKEAIKKIGRLESTLAKKDVQ
jgi:hypothetical protein